MLLRHAGNASGYLKKTWHVACARDLKKSLTSGKRFAVTGLFGHAHKPRATFSV